MSGVYLRWEGSAPPDPAFLQWPRAPNGLTTHYTKLKTNQEIILVNICILEITDTFLPFSQKLDIFAQRKR